jgi:hypothetical protein
MASGIPFGDQVENSSGTPVSGAKIYFKIKGTNTNATTYTDSALTVPAANPVVADAAGWFNTYLSPTVNYDVEIKSANDAITYRSFSESPSATGSQPVDATLTALAGLGLENRKITRGTGVDTGELVFSGALFGVQNVLDYGSNATAFTSAAAAGDVVIPPGSYTLSAKVTGDFYPSPFATFTTPANFAASAVRGFLTDKDDDPSIFRVPQRLLISKAAQDFAGSSQATDGDTWLQDAGAGFYHERASHIVAVSDRGAIGVLGASRASDRYTINGAVVWQASTAYSLNAIVGYAGRLYTVTVAGTTSTVAPTHTSGSVVDGTATLTWLDYTYLVPIGASFVGFSDVVDGTGTWAGYFEGIRGPDGSTVYAAEIAVKNRGSTDVVNTPYSVFPGGSTIGFYFAGGGDSALGAPTHPSTCAILIARNAETFNKGIVIGATAIEGTDGVTGTGVAISMAKGHVFEWQASDGQAATIFSSVSATANRVGLEFTNDAIRHTFQGEIGMQVEGAAGTLANYLRVIANTTGQPLRIETQGSDTNITVQLAPKGTGLIDIRGSSGNRVIGVGVNTLGFYNTTPVARPTITGSRGGNAALASLLAELTTMGLILNGTTA